MPQPAAFMITAGLRCRAGNAAATRGSSPAFVRPTGRPERPAILGRMHDGSSAGAGPDEEFDHQLTHVLATRGEELEEHSRALLATGSVLVTGPGLVLRARLRPPRWWRRGELQTTLEDTASRQVTCGGVWLDRNIREEPALIREITIRLAFDLAHWRD